jgi:hypothetical protein
MEVKKSGREFGLGTFLGDLGEEFLDKPLNEQVLEMGWSHACPVVNEVSKEYGPEWTLKRYAKCNFVFGLVVESAKDLNPKLHKLLTTSVPRLDNEFPGRFFNSEFIPETFDKEMSPLSTPWGYAIPRVIIEEMGRGKNNSDRTQERLLRALNVIDVNVKSSETPIELLIKLSEHVLVFDADPKAVLSHVLASGIRKEEGCWAMFNEIKKQIDENAPTLKKVYDAMSPEERTKEGIINF